jgi:predicted transcriptional regulator
MKQLIIELDSALARRLERVAPAKSRKRSEFVRAAIAAALDRALEAETREKYLRVTDAGDEYFEPAAWKPRAKKRQPK